MAHHWKMPVLGGCYGTDSKATGTWQAAAEVALDPFTVALAGAETVTGIGLVNTYTLLYPEAIILDSDIYHRARYQLSMMDVSPETLAVEVIEAVGPAGHFLGQKHTRQHMHQAMQRAITHEIGPDGKYRDPLEAARDQVDWILQNHQPEPLEKYKQTELARILKAADTELNRWLS